MTQTLLACSALRRRVGRFGQVNFDRFQEVDNVGRSHEIEKQRPCEERCYFIDDADRTLHPGVSVMSWIARQPISAVLCDAESVAVCDSVSEVVHELQYRRSIKITVRRQFVT